jgi:hypothetical protein
VSWTRRRCWRSGGCSPGCCMGHMREVVSRPPLAAWRQG